MTATEGKKARRDARELAATRPPDPYRGALTDPYTGRPAPDRAAADPAAPAVAGTPSTDRNSAAASPEPRLGAVADYGQLAAGTRAPGQAVLATIIAISMGAVLGLFGLLLLAIVSLQDEYGAPDRSFYRGSDSSYLVLAMLDFVLGACLVIGGISFVTGRLIGRLAITIAGWTVLALCGFWWLQATVNSLVPLVIALSSLSMLVLCYQACVTRWLGVLPAAQPE
ncbi:MAG TPA: hypothetical protein VGX49_04370 [Jatrophihabitans sp.]|nr:hypothetical protein [Jatrophihabitans sp.]